MREGEEANRTKPLILIHLEDGKENLLKLLKSCCKSFVIVFVFNTTWPIPFIHVVHFVYVCIVAFNINRFISPNKYIVEKELCFLSLAAFHPYLELGL